MMDPSLSNSMPIDPLNTTDSIKPYFGLPSFLFSLAPALQSSSSPFLSLQMLQTPRGNLSLALSRFISVESHSKESVIAQN